MKDHPEFPVLDLDSISASLEERDYSSPSISERFNSEHAAFSLRLNGRTALTGLRSAGQLEQMLSGVAVEANAGDVAGLLSQGHSSVEEVQVPLNPVERQKFLSEWSLKNGKLKGAKYSLVLLPLAACGGGGGEGTGSSSSGSGSSGALSFKVIDFFYV